MRKGSHRCVNKFGLKKNYHTRLWCCLILTGCVVSFCCHWCFGIKHFSSTRVWCWVLWCVIFGGVVVSYGSVIFCATNGRQRAPRRQDHHMISQPNPRNRRLPPAPQSICDAVYSVQERLAAVAEEAGVQLTFFHGKGGTVSRGGNPALYQVLSFFIL